MIKLLLNFSGRINTMAQNVLFPNSLRKGGRWKGLQTPRQGHEWTTGTYRRCMESISASSILQSVSSALVSVLASKLWVNISNTNCDLLYQISCTYIIVKYLDITRTLYLTIDSQLVGAGFLDHGVYCLAIGMFNGHWSVEILWKLNVWKKFVNFTFTKSVQWPMCNCLLCNKDSCIRQLFQQNKVKF